MASEQQLEGASTSGTESELKLYASPSNVTLVSATYTSLLMLMGQIDDEATEVVVPFVEVRFEGPEQEDGRPPAVLFSHVLSLDNAAYVVMDILSDLADVCRQFKSVSLGEVRPETRRLTATKGLLAEAKSNLERCLEELNGIPSKSP